MTRQEFKQQAKNTIDNLFEEVDQLENRLKEVSGSAEHQVHEKLDRLKQKKRELSNKYEQLEKTTENNWENVKSAFSESVQSFKTTLAK